MDSMSGSLVFWPQVGFGQWGVQQRKHREEGEKVGVFIPLGLLLIITLG